MVDYQLKNLDASDPSSISIFDKNGNLLVVFSGPMSMYFAGLVLDTQQDESGNYVFKAARKLGILGVEDEN